MRKPVPAELHKALMAAKDADVVRLTAECAKWEQRFNALAQQYADTLTVVPVITEPSAPKEKSELSRAIETESGGDPRVARHFRALARRLKDEGKDDDAIVAEIKWVPSALPESA